MKGHWHFERRVNVGLENIDSSEHQYNMFVSTFDFNGEFGIWNNNIGGFQGIHSYIIPHENRLVVSNGECYHQEYRYKFLNDSINLYQNGGTLLKGYKCNKNCCDKQKDYFLHDNIILDLPTFVSDFSIKQDSTESIKELRIIIGKSSIPDFYGKENKLSVNGIYTNLLDIDLGIEAMLMKNKLYYDSESYFAIYADKNTKYSEIGKILKRLETNGVKEVSIMSRKATNLRESFVIFRNKVSTEYEIGNVDKTIENWLKDEYLTY